MTQHDDTAWFEPCPTFVAWGWDDGVCEVCGWFAEDHAAQEDANERMV